MKIRDIMLVIIVTFSVCVSQTTTKPVICEDCDSLKTIVSGLEEKYSKIEKNIDSLNGKFISDNFITVKAMKEIQDKHDKVFEKMQTTFNNFISNLGVITEVLGIIIIAIVAINWGLNINSRKELKEELKKIKDFEKQIKEQKTEYEEIIEAFKNQKEEMKQYTDAFETKKEEIIEKTEFNTQIEKSIKEGFKTQLQEMKLLLAPGGRELNHQILNVQKIIKTPIIRKQDQEIPNFIDFRDGKIYRTTKIGTQIWMAENLKFNAFKAPVGLVRTINNEIYYNWETAQRACPSGWRLPSVEDWEQLVKHCGGVEIAGERLKSKNYGGADEFKFSAFMYGYFINRIGFNFIGERAIWWTSTEFNHKKSYVQCIDGKKCYKYEDGEYKENMFSIRCIKNEL